MENNITRQKVENEEKNKEFEDENGQTLDDHDNDKPVDLTMEFTSILDNDSSDEEKQEENSCKQLKRFQYKFTNKRYKLKHDLLEKEETKRRTANVQERHRMQKMNTALQQLKHCLPDEFKIYNKKMSKIRTLRVAIAYIKALEDMLDSTTPVKKEHHLISTPGPNAAYLAALGTCSPFHFNTPETNCLMEGLYSNPFMYQAYFPGSPHWMSSGYPSPVTQMTPMSTCFDTPKYPISNHPAVTPEMVRGSITPRYTPISSQNRHTERAISKRLVRSSVHTSPFGDGRNANELNNSFLSASSEDPDNECRKDKLNDCCFAMDGVYPLPPDDGIPEQTRYNLPGNV